IEQDFSTIRPSEYLFSVVPAHDVEHVVDAGLPTRAEAELLEIRAEEPCLTLMRRTWTSGVAVTFARFVHPGSRYRLGCRFSPDLSQRQGGKRAGRTALHVPRKMEARRRMPQLHRRRHVVADP